MYETSSVLKSFFFLSRYFSTSGSRLCNFYCTTRPLLIHAAAVQHTVCFWILFLKLEPLTASSKLRGFRPTAIQMCEGINYLSIVYQNSSLLSPPGRILCFRSCSFLWLSLHVTRHLLKEHGTLVVKTRNVWTCLIDLIDVWIIISLRFCSGR